MSILVKVKEIIYLLIILGSIPCFTYAQNNSDSLKNDWGINWEIGADAEWNDNVFKLSTSQMDRMNLNDSGDVVSGRFNDMESINDIILSIVPQIEIKTKKGLFDRSLSFSGKIGYQHFIHNNKRSNVKLGLSVQQKISKSGKIELLGEYAPSIFLKNYLAEATDTTGGVSPAERIYLEGVYNELELLLSYHHRFRKWIMDAKGNLFLGYRTRNYDDWFTGRNQDAIKAGLSGEIEPAKWMIFKLGYYIESVNSPITPEVMILDEPDYQIDFNNDRDFADNNRRTIQTVNRSRTSQNIEIGLNVIPVKHLVIIGELKFRFKDYESQEPIDPNYKDRKDTKTKYAFGIEYRIVKGLFLMFKFESTTQQTNRVGDPESDGEITDYKTQITKAGIKWLF